MILRVAILTLCLSPAVLSADIVNYGNVESPGMFFMDVTESSVFDALPLFGSPVANGNGIEFNNPTFEASTGANQIDFVDGRMNMTVVSKHGETLTGINLYESGAVINAGIDMQTAVNAIAFAIADGKVYQGTFSVVTQTPTNDKWDRGLSIRFDEPVSSFSLVMDNQLFAFSGEDSNAFINKDFVGLSVSVVPEPSACLGLVGLATLALRRRR